jgi:hypothetical protein
VGLNGDATTQRGDNRDSVRFTGRKQEDMKLTKVIENTKGR